MKNIILLTLISVSCFAQQESRQFGIIEVFRGGDSLFIKKLTTQVINISDGTVTKMRTPPDTAKLFLASDGGIYEGVITWKKVVVDPDPVETVTIVDSSPDDPANKYYGGWQHRSGASWLDSFHGNTGSYTTGTADSLVITVDGYKAEWYTEKRFDHGIAEVRIDNKFAAGIDLYSSRTDNNSQLVWTGLFLTDGPHKITIRFTGQKNDASTQATIIHDYIKIFKND